MAGEEMSEVVVKAGVAGLMASREENEAVEGNMGIQQEGEEKDQEMKERKVEEARARRVAAELRLKAVQEEEARRMARMTSTESPFVTGSSHIRLDDDQDTKSTRSTSQGLMTSSAIAGMAGAGTTGASREAPLSLLNSLSTLPRQPLTVYITGMTGVAVGISTVKRVLEEGIEYLELSSYVTLRDDCEPPLQHDSSCGRTLVLSVYDICNEKSFKFCVKDQCKKFAAVYPVVLVGNKVDLEYWRQVKVQSADASVQALKPTAQGGGHHLEYIEISAFTGLHVGYLMDVILKHLFSPHFNCDFVNKLIVESAHADAGSDPELLRYFRMLRLGVAVEAVMLKMSADGVSKRVVLQRFPRVEYIPALEDELSDSTGSGSDISSDYDSSDNSSDASNEIKKRIHPKHRRGSKISRGGAGIEKRKQRKKREDTHTLLDSISGGKNLKSSGIQYNASQMKEESIVQTRKLPMINSVVDGSGAGGSINREAPARPRRKEMKKKKKSPQLRHQLDNKKDLETDGFGDLQLSPPPPPPPSSWSSPPRDGVFPPAPLSPSQNSIPQRELEQEEALSKVIESVENIKSISASISSELQEQGQLLNEMENNMDISDLNVMMDKRRNIVFDDDDDDDEDLWLDQEVIIEEEEEWGDEDSLIDVDVDVGDEESSEYFGDEDNLGDVQRSMDSVKNVMHANIDLVMERGDKLDLLVESSDSLNQQSAQFYRQSKKQSRNMVLKSCLCCCCIVCVHSAHGCADVCRSCARNTKSGVSKCISSLKEFWRSLIPKKSLMDNVLADTENAFQTLAKSLNFLVGNNDKFKCFGAVYYYVCGIWHKLLAWVVSFGLILSSTVVMILPSFFTLLIVRTSTIEKESKSLGIRQETIRHEKKEQSALRWLRIILRSLPMSFYLLVLPYFLVYRVFPTMTNDRITLLLVGYLGGVIILQVLGSVRVFHSWKTRDASVPSAPEMYYMETVEENKSTLSSLTSCCRSSNDKSFDILNSEDLVDEKGLVRRKVKKKTPVPVPPNTFTKSAANIIVLLSLSLEYFQMAFFSLQSNPLDGDSREADSGVVFAPTASPTVELDDDFWGAKVFDSVYIKVSLDSDFTLLFIWAAVGVVALLIVVFATQFLFELKLYGHLLQRIEDKDEAKDSFFFSFTGAIVYGHGKPNNISKKMRMVVSILSDALFLVISMQLLTALACDFDGVDTEATLRVKESVVCWEGEHALLATLSLMAYAFYVPLSIMITPMLLEVPSSDDKATPKDEGVAFLKLYLMTINVVKSVMLVVAVLGPQTISALVMTTTVSSFLLGGITISWFSKQDISSLPYFAAIHPCNMAFINYWKAASYTTSVVSALVVVSFHVLEDSTDFVSQRSLTDTLLTSWICIVVVYLILYRQYHKSATPRRELVSNLIGYPFMWRDMLETKGQTEWLCWWSDDEAVEHLRHIPGSHVSPWLDFRLNASVSTAPDSFTGEAPMVEEVHGGALSYRLIQHFTTSNK